MNAPNFQVKHVGLNTESAVAAETLNAALCQTFGLTRGHESDTHIFAGGLFEVMKHSKLGERGHVGLQTPDVEAAMAYLAEQGITFRQDTIRRGADGKINFVYLTQEFGGFAVHLTV